MPSVLPSELTRATRGVLAAVAMAIVAMPQAQAAGVSGQGTWETTLQGRDLDGNTANGFEAYYDTALNITWLADAKYAKTSGYDADGEMSWNDAQTWVAQLIINGTSGWRLPALVDLGSPGCDFSSSGTDCGWNVDTNTSELAHMYHVTLGNKAVFDTSGYFPQSGGGLSNTGPFSNVNPFIYWFGLAYASDPIFAWSFSFSTGYQDGYIYKLGGLSAWAVRSGDVAAAVVPEPQSYALALVGLTTLLVARGRRQR